MSLLEPTEVEIQTDKQDSDGKPVMKTYILSKFPAVAGRAIVAQYLLSAIPKIGEYKTNEEQMFKLMNYVAVQLDNGTQLRLSTAALIDNHVDSWETGLRIEAAMLQKNCSFFRDGRILSFLKDFAPNLKPLLSKMLTPSSAPSSEPTKPHSTS